MGRRAAIGAPAAGNASVRGAGMDAAAGPKPEAPDHQDPLTYSKCGVKHDEYWRVILSYLHRQSISFSVEIFAKR
jgi:hypothetical protein